MTEKRFITGGYKIYDTYKDDEYLVNNVDAQRIVDTMNNIDTKARERSKALSKLQKENEVLIQGILMKEENINNLKDDIKKCNIQCRELGNENEQLKTQLQNTSDQRDEFHRGARENANRVGKLEKENEQLKKGVHHSYDEHKRIVNNYCDKIRELEEENKKLKEYRQEVTDVLMNLTTEQLQIIIAIIKELNLKGNDNYGKKERN